MPLQQIPRLFCVAQICFVEQRLLELMSGGNTALPVLKEKLVLLMADSLLLGFSASVLLPANVNLLRNQKKCVFSFCVVVESKENPLLPSN